MARRILIFPDVLSSLLYGRTLRAHNPGRCFPQFVSTIRLDGRRWEPRRAGANSREQKQIPAPPHNTGGCIAGVYPQRAGWLSREITGTSKPILYRCFSPLDNRKTGVVATNHALFHILAPSTESLTGSGDETSTAGGLRDELRTRL